MKYETLRGMLLGLCACREVLALPPMQTALELLTALNRGDAEAGLSSYASLFYALRQEGADSLGAWLNQRLRWDESPYSLLVSRGGEDAALTAAARRDVETLAQLAEVDFRQTLIRLTKGTPYAPAAESLPLWERRAPFTFEDLTESYRANGTGLFAQHRAFVWEGDRLEPVINPDCGEISLMVGYEQQREEVIANTRALVEGKEANNVLLYGESGTGKSATVKSLLTVPGLEKLRLVEADKGSLTGLPRLIRTLARRPEKFIVFIDDLAFDKDDKTYSALKTILEGGLERRPANTAVYATSNRRRLVRQTISDRDGDEWDAKETVDEKTALSERFGVRIAFLPLNKGAYLELVEQLAQQSGISMDREELRRRALQWELYHPGRTPRTAKQFLAGLER